MADPHKRTNRHIGTLHARTLHIHTQTHKHTDTRTHAHTHPTHHTHTDLPLFVLWRVRVPLTTAHRRRRLCAWYCHGSHGGVGWVHVLVCLFVRWVVRSVGRPFIGSLLVCLGAPGPSWANSVWLSARLTQVEVAGSQEYPAWADADGGRAKRPAVPPGGVCVVMGAWYFHGPTGSRGLPESPGPQRQPEDATLPQPLWGRSPRLGPSHGRVSAVPVVSHRQGDGSSLTRSSRHL
jgi:hypothetical protein